MKFNWGTGIVIFLGAFVITIGVVLYNSVQQRHDLVTTDYYQQELAYQSTIDGKRNAAALAETCLLSVQDQKLLLKFPEELQGKSGNLSVTMYFPTQAEKDFELSEETWTIADYKIPGDKISAGKWIAKVRLEIEGKPYYFEPSIVL